MDIEMNLLSAILIIRGKGRQKMSNTVLEIQDSRSKTRRNQLVRYCNILYAKSTIETIYGPKKKRKR